MNKKLRIFVSGKEEELDDERATIIELIESMGFEAIASENRSASSESAETEFLGEVESADIYIGVFGIEDSPASINEFITARNIGIDTLVFEKDVDQEKRKEEVKKFLSMIKNPKTGLYVPKYKNVLDLRELIVNGLSYTLTKKFKIAQQIQQEKNQKDAEKSLIDSIKDHQKNDKLIEKMKIFPFKTRFSKDFGKAEFIDFRILSEIRRGEEHIVTAKIKGSTKNGFLDLAIKTPEGAYHWYPDPHSYDSGTDNGILDFENKGYERQWPFVIPDRSGKYLAIMGLYENNYENRELVNFEIMELSVV